MAHETPPNEVYVEWADEGEERRKFGLNPVSTVLFSSIAALTIAGAFLFREQGQVGGEVPGDVDRQRRIALARENDVAVKTRRVRGQVDEVGRAGVRAEK